MTLDASGKPTTRFDIVSGGIGKLAGGLINLILGGVVWFFHKEAGLSLLLLGLALLGFGCYSIARGASAAQKEVACPHCNETNALLSDVNEFACVKCGSPLRLR